MRFLRIIPAVFYASLVWVCVSLSVVAGDATVAVASNFLKTAETIVVRFQAETGHNIILANGATGALYAQITQGAPFDLFLSADLLRIDLLDEAGLLLQHQKKPYATGILVLFARDGDVLKDTLQSSLTSEQVQFVALANKETAPYGLAASEVLLALGLTDAVANKVVLGSNVNQAFSYIMTGNAQMGFVALSLVRSAGVGHWLDIPAEYYAPVIQGAGLLKHSQGNNVAQEFYNYLSTPAARQIIADAGYKVE